MYVVAISRKAEAQMEQEAKPLKTSEAEIYMSPHNLRGIPYDVNSAGERLYDVETLDYFLNFLLKEC
tara:strand:- start:3119 stop:3319 length:201 start_codon:yes stop_codon:yes gene_type:complete